MNSVMIEAKTSCLSFRHLENVSFTLVI